MKSRTSVPVPSTVEHAAPADSIFAPVNVVRPQVDVVKANDEEAQMQVEEAVVVLAMLPAERPATPVDNLNPTLGIMGVVQAVN